MEEETWETGNEKGGESSSGPEGWLAEWDDIYVILHIQICTWIWRVLTSYHCGSPLSLNLHAVPLIPLPLSNTVLHLSVCVSVSLGCNIFKSRSKLSFYTCHSAWFTIGVCYLFAEWASCREKLKG